MQRHHLLNMLANYERVFPTESAMVARMRSLVISRPDCLLRTCRPGHITASAWVMAPDRRHVLLGNHRKLDKWLQLGGHADGQWDPIEVALREVREESALTSLRVLPIAGQLIPFDVDVHTIPARYAEDGSLLEDAHEHHDLRFLLLLEHDEPTRVSHESYEVRWYTPGEASQIAPEPSIHRMISKATVWMA